MVLHVSLSSPSITLIWSYFSGSITKHLFCIERKTNHSSHTQAWERERKREAKISALNLQTNALKEKTFIEWKLGQSVKWRWLFLKGYEKGISSVHQVVALARGRIWQCRRVDWRCSHQIVSNRSKRWPHILVNVYNERVKTRIKRLRSYLVKSSMSTSTESCSILRESRSMSSLTNSSLCAEVKSFLYSLRRALIHLPSIWLCKSLTITCNCPMFISSSIRRDNGLSPLELIPIWTSKDRDSRVTEQRENVPCQRGVISSSSKLVVRFALAFEPF